MIPRNPLFKAATMINTGYSISRQSLVRSASPQDLARDTVHFSSSARQSDKDFLESFFKENATDPSKVPNILAPPTRTEKAQSLAFQKYRDGLKAGKQPFLPKSYRESLVNGGFLKADNKSWDVERSAFRRFITEDLYKHDSEETRNNGLQEAGFKLKTRHKKTNKLTPAEMPATSPTSEPQAPEKQNVWKMDFDWAEEAASAPAFVAQAKAEQAKVEHPKKEDGQQSGFGQALLQLMARKPKRP